jgi:ribosomal-protein-alanine N-acetyltransferase
VKVKGALVFTRLPAPEDEAEFLALMRASARLHRGRVASPMRPKDFVKFLERNDRPNSVWLLVCRREDEKIVGAFHLDQIVYGNLRSAYIGYYAGAPFAGRGYMTEGMRLMLRQAFTRLKLNRVEANIQPDNAASLALVRRTGFTHEGYSRRYLKIGGRWRDHERWAITREDWRAANSRHGAKG